MALQNELARLYGNAQPATSDQVREVLDAPLRQSPDSSPTLEIVGTDTPALNSRNTTAGGSKRTARGPRTPRKDGRSPRGQGNFRIGHNNGRR